MSSMTPQEQFRVGFLLRCAEDGCTMDDVRSRVKTAMDKLSSIAPTAASVGTGAGVALGSGAVNAVSGAKNLLTDYMKSPLALTGAGIALSAGLGGSIGHGLAKAQSEDIDPQELKRQELLQAFKAHTARIRQLAALRQPQKPMRSPRLLH